MIVTVITMYRAHDAEMFTQVVEGSLTDAQRQEWRDAHDCDGEAAEDAFSDELPNNLFFRELVVMPNTGVAMIKNVDGEEYPEAPVLLPITAYKG